MKQHVVNFAVTVAAVVVGLMVAPKVAGLMNKSA